MARAASMDRQWMEERRGITEARIHALDFFGFALENTPLREEFWPLMNFLQKPYSRSGEAILACMEAYDTRNSQRHHASGITLTQFEDSPAPCR